MLIPSMPLLKAKLSVLELIKIISASFEVGIGALALKFRFFTQIIKKKNLIIREGSSKNGH